MSFIPRNNKKRNVSLILIISFGKNKTLNVMSRIITKDDFSDVYIKFKERGFEFLLSKLNIKSLERTKSAFDNTTSNMASNWWIIPKVRERWNLKMTGNPDVDYKKYYVQKYTNENDSLKLLSLGSGTCSNELEFASYPQFEEVVCVDISRSRLDNAAETAKKRNLNNMQFLCEDVYKYPFPEEYFDIILFNSSLHHFNNINHFIPTYIDKALKKNGRIIINEYVGADRLQFSKEDICAINKAIKLIDDPYRVKSRTNIIKKSFSGHGIIRMLMSDPSECIDSSSILPTLHKHYKVVEERPYGGNILQSALKDIAHHFIDAEEDDRKMQILNALFEFEDDYLLTRTSSFVFGIYEKE